MIRVNLITSKLPRGRLISVCLKTDDGGVEFFCLPESTIRRHRPPGSSESPLTTLLGMVHTRRR